MFYWHDDNLPKRLTMRAIILFSLRDGKPVYTNDRLVYEELKVNHPECTEELHFVDINQK
jgi:hypothetical protein